MEANGIGTTVETEGEKDTECCSRYYTVLMPTLHKG